MNDELCLRWKRTAKSELQAHVNYVPGLTRGTK